MNLSKFQVIVKDKEVWYAEVHVITMSQTWVSYWTTTKEEHVYLFDLALTESSDPRYTTAKFEVVNGVSIMAVFTIMKSGTQVTACNVDSWLFNFGQIAWFL